MFNFPSCIMFSIWWLSFSFSRIILYSASDPERGVEIGRATLPAHISCIQYHCDSVWVGLSSGSLAVFKRDHLAAGSWDLANPIMSLLGDEPVSCVLPIANGGLYAACGRRVWVMDAFTGEQVVSSVFLRLF